jgi:hypothetical protein
MNSETLKAILGTKKAVAVLASSMSLVAGAALGAAIATRRLAAKLEEQFEQDLEEAREYYSELYSKRNKAGAYDTPEKAAAILIPETETTGIEVENTEMIRTERIIKSSNYGKPIAEEVLTQVAYNVFSNARSSVELTERGHREARPGASVRYF